MLAHSSVGNRVLYSMIRRGNISFAGHAPQKIYGTLTCKSGRKMSKANRVFFESEEEAVSHGFRPCGHCMYTEYKNWKNGYVYNGR